MAEAGLFARFARIEAETYDIEVLPADRGCPAFIVQANLLTDEQARTLREKHMKFPKKLKPGQPRERELDQKTYWPAWISRTVVGWSGLTKRNLPRLIIGFRMEDEAAFDNLYPNGEIAFSVEWAQQLHEVAENTFTALIINELNDIRQGLMDAEQEERETALGNSDTGSGSPSELADTSMSHGGAPASTQNTSDAGIGTLSVATGS